MKKYLFSVLTLSLSCGMANAQLAVDSVGKVSVSSESTSLKPRLSVGWNEYFNEYYSTIGIAGTPKQKTGKVNIGIEGTIVKEAASSKCDIGVLGVVNTNHESSTTNNYGVLGMLGGYGSTDNGGAGIFGSSNSYPYYYPISMYDYYAGYFYGPVVMTGNLTVPNVYTTSDLRLKDNIVPLNETDESGLKTLDNILNLNVVEYNYKDNSMIDIEKSDDINLSEDEREAIEAVKRSSAEMASRRHIGLIAQELKEIYPDMVQEGKDGYLAVNYTELVPVLIRSIQVLKQEIDELKGVDGSARMVPQSSGMNPINATSKNKLFQNTPNPFKEKTIIRFQLADDVRDAAVCIFDMSGKLLKKMPVSSGMDSVSINGFELGEGMFLYSLLINGQETDTKKMIISK